MSTPSCDREKLREAILHLAMSSEDDLHFGKTKLYKLLFFSDFAHFVSTGQAITWAEYRCFPFGPVPTEAEPLIEEMARAGELAIQHRDHFGYQQVRPIALREAELSRFSGAEVARLERTVRDLRQMNASGVSELSHHFLGWQVAGERELIPYEIALIVPGPPTEHQEAYAAGLVAAGR